MSIKVENTGFKPIIADIKPIKSDAKLEISKDKTEQVKKLAGTDRIAKWFSQAGIYSISSAKQKQSIDHKISERLKLKT